MPYHDHDAYHDACAGMPQADAEALVRAIPMDELPIADDRATLVAALVAGEVEDVYRPFGADYYNITLPVPAWVDPRLCVREWAELRHSHSGRDIPALLIAEASGQTPQALRELRQARDTREER